MTQTTKPANKRPTKTTEKPEKPARTDAEMRLWEALERHPGDTAKRLTEIAGVGRSTATKTLSRWAVTGHLTRNDETDGTSVGSRPASTWTLATSTEHATAHGRPRLRPGELRAAVAAYLAAPQRYGQPHTPVQVARTLGRSAGAVANALHRLATDGAITQTSDRPRRYTHPPATNEPEATATPKTSAKSRRRAT